jgi:hypothetical protein
MKKILSVFVLALMLNSCTDDATFNTPAVQGKLDGTFWRAVNSSATISSGGVITINAMSRFEDMYISFPAPTSASGIARYDLGTTNRNANVEVVKRVADVTEVEFETAIIQAPVNKLVALPVAGGTGYVATAGASTSGGSGTGLKVRTTVEQGVVKKAEIVFSGDGYKAGDIITIVGGNNNAKIRVLNVQGSNGEIQITEYDSANGTISGKFFFNAANVDNNPLAGEVLNFSEGVFYKIKIVPGE